MTEDIAALREHVAADHEALARVWALAAGWRNKADELRDGFSRPGGLTGQIIADTLDSAAADLRRAVTECPECGGSGIVYVETGCGGCSGYPGITHEPACGLEPCPLGCPVPGQEVKDG